MPKSLVFGKQLGNSERKLITIPTNYGGNMPRLRFVLFVFLLLFSVFTANSLACTTFCLKNKGEVLFGKNYDWMISDGLVIVNKRGVAKTSVANGEKNPANWISKYGSVTFNQYGRENPMGGMNEAGVVIELMWLDETEYPARDERAVVDVLEWIQYNLDTAATTGEVLANAEKLRISSPITLHYLVSDKTGNAATIEFLGGKLTTHSGAKLPVATLTNDTYDRSIQYALSAKDAATEGSLDQFARAAGKIREFENQPRTEKEAVDYAFEILSSVAQKNSTQWSIVYDQKRGKIYFRTRPAPQVKVINTRGFDYSCASPVKIFNINSEGGGEVTSLFTDYTTAANRDLIERSFNGTSFLKGTPASVRNEAAGYPERFACSAKQSPITSSTKTASGSVAIDLLLSSLFEVLAGL
jgi:penicillin V acylase-like amidase (Ntn superfamily)